MDKRGYEAIVDVLHENEAVISPMPVDTADIRYFAITVYGKNAMLGVLNGLDAIGVMDTKTAPDRHTNSGPRLKVLGMAAMLHSRGGSQEFVTLVEDLYSA